MTQPPLCRNGTLAESIAQSTNSVAPATIPEISGNNSLMNQMMLSRFEHKPNDLTTSSQRSP
uniref:Uncharacterized protein n=1 Tax=Arion vulgaris TaxID=1028688 RepID=A0A0B7B3C9_9EUPU